MALQWMILGYVLAAEAAVAILLTLPSPKLVKSRLVSLVSLILQPAMFIIPFAGFQLLDIYWKNEHRLMCSGETCTTTERDRYEKTIMSDSSSCVDDVTVNDSINNNTKLDDDGDKNVDVKVNDSINNNTKLDDDKKDSCECSKICHEEEDDIMKKKKYGGLLRKKPSLISKDHERAFFDSADWALRKQLGASERAKGGSLEELLPKLEPTPHHQLQSKRLAYASSSTNHEYNHENTSDAAKLDGDEDDHEDELIPNKN